MTKRRPPIGASSNPRQAAEKSSHRMEYRGEQCVLPEMRMLGWDRLRAAAPGELDEHIHADAYELCFLAGGSVDWWVEDSVHEVRRGEVYVTRPGERHGGVDAVMQPCELYWVGVNLKIARDFVDPSLTRAVEAMTLRSFPGSPALPRRFDELLSENSLRGPLSVPAARAALHGILLTIVRDHDAHRATLDARAAGTSPAVRRALRWLEEHAVEDFAMDELAAVAGLSTGRFHERFLQEVGFTPGEYRSRLRITLAKRLLREGKRAVTDIAFDLGFSSSQYFATVFRNHSGLTPREYQQRDGAAKVRTADERG